MFPQLSSVCLVFPDVSIDGLHADAFFPLPAQVTDYLSRRPLFFGHFLADKRPDVGGQAAVVLKPAFAPVGSGLRLFMVVTVFTAVALYLPAKGALRYSDSRGYLFPALFLLE